MNNFYPVLFCDKHDDEISAKLTCGNLIMFVWKKKADKVVFIYNNCCSLSVPLEFSYELLGNNLKFTTTSVFIFN